MCLSMKKRGIESMEQIMNGINTLSRYSISREIGIFNAKMTIFVNDDKKYED